MLLKPSFTSMRIEVTSKCNFECKYCFASDSMNTRKDQDLSFNQLEQILKKARQSKIRKVLFSGGEPLVRNDFIDILRISEGLETSFVTNGYLLTNDRIQEIAKLNNVNRIRLSIDGYDAHDSMRMGNSSSILIKRLKAIKEIAPRISVVPHSLATPSSISEIPSLLSELELIGVDRWRLFLIRLGGKVSQGNLDINANYYISYIDLLCQIATLVKNKSLNMQIETDGGYQSDLDITLERFSVREFTNYTHPCEYLIHVLIIRSNGDISICPFFDFSCCKIQDHTSINDLELTPSLIAWRNLRIEKMLICNICRYRRICKGGCRKSAVELLGSFFAEDPIYCFMLPIIEKKLWPLLSSKSQNHYHSLLDYNGLFPKWSANDLNILLNNYFEKQKKITS